MKKINYSSLFHRVQLNASVNLRFGFIAMLLVAVLVAGCAPAPEVETLPAPAENVTANTWEEISVAEAASRYNAGVLMLDVRQPEEWEEIHIPGATLIPLGELPQRLGELPKDQEIVVYCRSGNRSQSGAEILAKNGFSGVTSMAGGITEWSTSGYPTESGQ